MVIRQVKCPWTEQLPSNICSELAGSGNQFLPPQVQIHNEDLFLRQWE